MRVLMTLIILAVLVLIAFGLWRARRAQLREERRAAWQAKRAEEDRIWYEKMGEDSLGG
jgi:type II secretory pathway pseudopilin PulG